MFTKNDSKSKNNINPSNFYLEIKFEEGKISSGGTRTGYIDVNKFKGLTVKDKLPPGITKVPPEITENKLRKQAIVIVDGNNKLMGTGKEGATSKEDIESILSGNFNRLVETYANQRQKAPKKIKFIEISFTKDGIISQKEKEKETESETESESESETETETETETRTRKRTRTGYIDVNKFKGLTVPDKLPPGITEVTAEITQNQLREKAIVIVDENNNLCGKGIESTTSKEDVESILSGNFNGRVETYANQRQKVSKEIEFIEISFTKYGIIAQGGRKKGYIEVSNFNSLTIQDKLPPGIEKVKDQITENKLREKAILILDTTLFGKGKGSAPSEEDVKSILSGNFKGQVDTYTNQRHKSSKAIKCIEISFTKDCRIASDGERKGYIDLKKFKGLRIPDNLPDGIQPITVEKTTKQLIENAIVIIDDNNKLMGTGINGATSREDIDNILSGKYKGLVETSLNQRQKSSKEINLIEISFNPVGRISPEGLRTRKGYIDLKKFEGLRIPDKLPDGIQPIRAEKTEKQLKENSIVIVGDNKKLCGTGINGATSKEDIDSILSGKFNGRVETYAKQRKESPKEIELIEISFTTDGRISSDGTIKGHVEVNRFNGLRVTDPLPDGIKKVIAEITQIQLREKAIVILDKTNKLCGPGTGTPATKEDIDSILSGQYKGRVETYKTYYTRCKKNTTINNVKKRIKANDNQDDKKKNNKPQKDTDVNNVKKRTIANDNQDDKKKNNKPQKNTDINNVKKRTIANDNQDDKKKNNKPQKDTAINNGKKRTMANDNQDDEKKNNKRQKNIATNNVKKRTMANDNQDDKKKNNKRQKNIAINDVKKRTAINNVKERTMANDNQPVEGSYNLRFFNNNPNNKSNNSQKKGSLQNDNSNKTTNNEIMINPPNVVTNNGNEINKNSEPQNHDLDGDHIIDVFNIDNW